MAEYLQRLYQGQPTNPAGEELFVVPAQMACIVKQVEIINIEPLYGLSDSMTMWVVGIEDSGPELTNIWIPETELGPGERLTWGGGDSMALEVGAAIWAGPSVGGSSAILNVLITGMLVDELLPGT